MFHFIKWALLEIKYALYSMGLTPTMRVHEIEALEGEQLHLLVATHIVSVWQFFHHFKRLLKTCIVCMYVCVILTLTFSLTHTPSRKQNVLYEVLNKD